MRKLNVFTYTDNNEQIKFHEIIVIVNCLYNLSITNLYFIILIWLNHRTIIQNNEVYLPTYLLQYTNSIKCVDIKSDCK